MNLQTAISIREKKKKSLAAFKTPMVIVRSMCNNLIVTPLNL